MGDLQITFSILLPLRRLSRKIFCARGERTSRMIFGAGSMMASNLVATFSRVAVVTLLTRIYTQEQFGVWATITSMTAVMATSDFGVGNALRTKLLIFSSRGEEGNSDARRHFLAVFYFFLVVSLLFSLLILVCGQLLPIETLFKTHDLALQSDAKYIILAVQVIMLVGIPFGIGATAFFSYQESHFAAWLGLVSALLTSAVVCFMAFKKYSIVGCAIGYFLVPLLMSIFATAIFFRRRKWQLSLMKIKEIWSTVYGLLALSIKFAVLQVAGAFLFNSPTLVISATINVGEAANFNLVQKLFVFIISLYVGMFNPFVAGYGEAAARKDWQWCEKTLLKSIQYTFLFFGLLIVVFYFFGNFFLHVLAGKGYVSNPTMFLSVGVWAMLYALYTCCMAFQTSIGKINISVIHISLLAIVAVSFEKYMGGIHGSLGVSTAVCCLFLSLVITTPMEALHFIRKNRKE